MPSPSPTFIITRDGQEVDRVTLDTHTLRVGRGLDCEILLDHHTVSRLHAGINETDGRFYLINRSASHTVTLNARLVEFNVREAIADGDVAQIGSFSLHMSRAGDALRVNITYQVAANILEGGKEAIQEQALTPESTTTTPKVADALDEFWDKRALRGVKAERLSLLHPKRPTRTGKAQFNWGPTRDLIRSWPVSVFVWALIVIGAISATAALLYAKAYSSGPISSHHETTSLLNATPANAIAKQPNSGSCTNCHSVGGSMEANCASCHQTQAFVADVTGIPAHIEAGIGCVSCHGEHQGAGFQPAESAVTICAKCHNDANKELYRGRSVFTPHGGTGGYPVEAGKWKWKGLDDEHWKLKPDALTDAMKKARERQPVETDDQSRNRQFHMLHLHRILARGVGLQGNEEGELSCSSCHNSIEPIDRSTPITTCARCHNGNTGQLASSGNGPLIGEGSPNCSSCHIQHVKQPRHWNSRLLASMSLRAAN